MKVSGNTILITGGATGIGLALAEAFVHLGNKVVICGRRRNKLLAAKKQNPQLEIRVCDVSRSASRTALVRWMEQRFPSLNILVNNAGIQRRFDFSKGTRDLRQADQEIATNLVAPIHLTALLLSFTQETESGGHRQHLLGARIHALSDSPCLLRDEGSHPLLKPFTAAPAPPHSSIRLRDRATYGGDGTGWPSSTT